MLPKYIFDNGGGSGKRTHGHSTIAHAVIATRTNQVLMRNWNQRRRGARLSCGSLMGVVYVRFGVITKEYGDAKTIYRPSAMAGDKREQASAASSRAKTEWHILTINGH